MIQTNPHLQQRVEHYGPPIHEARIVVVLVHGRTITPEYMYEHVVLPLALEDVAFVAPAAADNSWDRISAAGISASVLYAPPAASFAV